METLIIDTEANMPRLIVNHDKNNMTIENILEYYQNTIDKQVTGWFYILDVALIHMIMKKLQKDVEGDVCELGVAYGKSAIGLSLCKETHQTLHLFDYFKEGISLEEAKSAVDKYGNGDKIAWNQIDLLTIKPGQLKFDKPLKFLHVDACHQHRYLLNDLKNFSAHMHEDGVIALDDINDMEYPGINSALAEFTLSEEGKDWVLFAIGANKAYICKKKNFKKYRDDLFDSAMKIFNGVPTNITEIFRYNVLTFTSRHPLSQEDMRKKLEENFYYEP